MLVVVLLDVFLADVDVGADFLADDFLGEDALADVVFEVFPVEAVAGDSLFEIFHAGELILNTDGIKALDDVGLDAEAHVFAALDEEGLVDQIFERVFLTVLDPGCFDSSGVHLPLQSSSTSSAAVCLALSSSERVMISLFTRAMISSTVLELVPSGIFSPSFVVLAALAPAAAALVDFFGGAFTAGFAVSSVSGAVPGFSRLGAGC